MPWKILVAAFVAVLLAAGGATLVLVELSGDLASGPLAATRSSPTPNPSSRSRAGAATPLPTTTPSASPTPTASVAGACTAGQLDLAVGAGTAASGGQEGVTALIADHSSTACELTGGVQAQLLTASGSMLSTSQGAEPAGQAWLVPNRVALDPWDPQPGEATVLISGHTGDTAPGVCSGQAPEVGELSLGIPGGGDLIAPVDSSPSLPQGMTVCRGAVQLSAITQVSSPPAPASNAQAAADSAVEEQVGESIAASCTPSAGQSCLTRSGVTGGTDTHAAYVQYHLYGTGNASSCLAYVYQDAAGWHALDVVCSQGDLLAPFNGGAVAISVPGGGCAPVHAAPGHATTVLSCVSPGPGTTYVVENAPVYVAETDPTSQLAMGTLWWYLQGLGGWVAQDLIAGR